MGKKAKEKEEKKSWRADSVICGTLCICQVQTTVQQYDSFRTTVQQYNSAQTII